MNDVQCIIYNVLNFASVCCGNNGKGTPEVQNYMYY